LAGLHITRPRFVAQAIPLSVVAVGENQPTMPRAVDARLVIGNAVQTRAKLVTSDAECRRLYGSLWKTKVVSGIVRGVEKPLRNGRRQTLVTADWNLQERVKRVTLLLVNVKPPASQNDTETGAAVTEGAINEPEPESIGNISEVPVVTVTDTPPSTTPSTRGVTQGDDDAAPKTVANGRDWEQQEVRLPLNCSVRQRNWKVIGPVDEILVPGNAISGMTPYDFFMWMFPQKHLTRMVEWTNQNLEKRSARPVTGGEVLRFFGMLILMTRFEFSNRRSLWSKKSDFKYVPAPRFGKMMSRNRFEEIYGCIQFGPCLNDSDVSSSQLRWSRVTPFVNAINAHRRQNVTPSESICVDESMSRWYGLGGDWSEIGLPHYVAMDRKPENGCELKTASCGSSGIMLSIEIVQSAMDSQNLTYESELPHGTAVLLRLVEPWFQTGRIVCADSYFASVRTAEELLKCKMKFIGVVKTATKEYPMKFLSEQELSTRGQYRAMVSESSDGESKLMAVMWMDRDRR